MEQFKDLSKKLIDAVGSYQDFYVEISFCDTFIKVVFFKTVIEQKKILKMYDKERYIKVNWYKDLSHAKENIVLLLQQLKNENTKFEEIVEYENA